MSSHLLMIEDDARLAQMVGETWASRACMSRTAPMAQAAWRNCKALTRALCPTWSSST